MYHNPTGHWCIAAPKHQGSYLTFVILYSFISFIFCFPMRLPALCELNSFGLFFFTAISPALETLSSTVQAIDKYLLGTMLSLSATLHKILLVDMSVFPISQGLTNIFRTGPVSKYFLFCRPHDSCWNYSILLLKHDNNHS